MKSSSSRQSGSGTPSAGADTFAQRFEVRTEDATFARSLRRCPHLPQRADWCGASQFQQANDQACHQLKTPVFLRLLPGGPACRCTHRGGQTRECYCLRDCGHFRCGPVWRVVARDRSRLCPYYPGCRERPKGPPRPYPDTAPPRNNRASFPLWGDITSAALAARSRALAHA